MQSKLVAYITDNRKLKRIRAMHVTSEAHEEHDHLRNLAGAFAVIHRVRVAERPYRMNN